ncbi:hypothetical protein FRC08_007123 [Ceratobasidium sp. 394]|nr:hypothetical protein FRC08_007123 [Ceratobasidium sp. 394]
MFIGMLEDISTNSRIGELEQTLHRELIMAANLKATIDKWNSSKLLEPYADVIGNFLDSRPRGIFTAVPGRIEAILQEPDCVDGGARIIVLARAFTPLSVKDAANDPYGNHPIVGATHMNIMGLFYDSIDLNRVHIIEPEDIVSHIAVCGFTDPHGTMSAPCVVILDLDMKHVFRD